jgi:hypothetical protein
MLASLSLVLALASPAAPGNGSPSALEQRACEQQFRVLAKSMGSSEKPSAKDLEACAGAFREARAASGMDEGQYGRWLQCQAESATAFGGPCDKMLYEVMARKAGDSLDAMFAEDKRRERSALASLALFRNKGLISGATFKEIEGASRDNRHGSLTNKLEDALQVLQEGRVRSGTDLAIYPKKAITSLTAPAPPAEKGERAADLAFVDGRTGRRVVRFSRLNYALLALRIDNGEVANAMKWVGEKPDARSIEVAIATDKEHGADLLLRKGVMDVAAKLGKKMSPPLRRVPLLVQGKTSISYDRWLALAATFHARGLDGEDADEKALARLVTLDDLERTLR